MLMTSKNGLYLICAAMICIMLLKRTSVNASCNACIEDGFDCHPEYFRCFRDCCLSEEAFCDREKKKCTPCNKIRHNCGNHSMPLECRLFCYKLRAGETAGPDQGFSRNSCVTALLGIGTLCALLAFSFGITVIWYNYKTQGCPRCSKKLWKRKKKDARMMAKDMDMKNPLVTSSLKTPSLKSKKSQAEVNTSDLGLTTSGDNEPGEATPETPADTCLPSGPTNVQPTESTTPEQPVFAGCYVNARTSATATYDRQCPFNENGQAGNAATHQLSSVPQPKLNNIIPSNEQSKHSTNERHIAVGCDDPSRGYIKA